MARALTDDLARLARSIERARETTRAVAPVPWGLPWLAARPQANPARPPRVLPGQLGLLGALAASTAAVEAAVARLDPPARPAPSPPPPPDPRAPRMDRYTLETGRAGFDVLDRITGTSTRRAHGDPAFATEAAARAELARLEGAWRAMVADRFADPSLSEERRRTLIENAIAARLLDRAAWADDLRPARAALSEFVAPEGETFAAGELERVRAVRAKGGVVRRGARVERAAGEACETVSADSLGADELAPPAPRTFEVLEGAMPELRRQIEAWNRKARKLKTLGLSITEGPRLRKTLSLSYEIETSRGVDVLHKDVERWVVPVTVHGEIPRFNGWQLVAKLVPAGARNVVNAVGDLPVPLRFRDRTNTCDHCGTSRKRSETFVLYHEGSRRYVQLGRSCINDFLPGLDAADVIGLLEAIPLLRLEAERSYGGDAARRASDLGLAEYLTHVAETHREHGWTSAAAARTTGRQSTADEAWENYQRQFARDARVRAAYRAPTAADASDAAAAIAHWREAPPQSDLEHDLHAIAQAGMVDRRTIGKAAWMLVGHKRLLGEQLAKKTAPAASTKRHVGTVGAPLSTTVTVVRTRELGGQYGGVAYSMLDPEGNELVWFGGEHKMQEGHRYAVQGSVERHTEYRGVPQTQLKRVSVLEDVTPAEALPPSDDPFERVTRALLERSRRGELSPYRVVRQGRPEPVVFAGERQVIAPMYSLDGALGAMRMLDPILRTALDQELARAGVPGSDWPEHGAYLTRPRAAFVQAFLVRRAEGPAGAAGFKSVITKGDETLVRGAGRAKVVVKGETPEAFVEAARAHPELAPLVAQAEAFYDRVTA